VIVEVGGYLDQAARRGEVVKRLTIVNEQRTMEAKQKAIEAMQRALGSAPKPP
jgi:hypothetical protein